MKTINLTIAKKLMALASVVMLITGGALVYLAFEIRQNDAVINGVIDEQAQLLGRLQTVHAAAKKFDDVRFWLTDLAVSWQNESEEEADAASEELQALLTVLEASDKELIATIRPMTQQYQDIMIEAVDAYVDENRVLGNSNVAEGRELARTVGDRLGALSEQVDALAKDSTGALLQNNGTLLMTALIALAAAIVIGVAITVLISRMITRPVKYAVDVADRISNGDLCGEVEVRSKDETGRLLTALKTMQAKLTEVISEIKTSSGAVRSGSDEIAQGNASLSERTEQQASSLEETASSMEEMTATVKQNADNANQANQLAAGAREQAERGGEVVGQAVSAMSEINTSSKKIADIIGVIDEIAFQTNLLALNAAVEAARAGEQGRGFAVVASEVRNLAQRSATAAKEIKELIQDSVGKVQEGSKLVDQSGQTLEEIVNSVKKVSDIVAEIAAASQEQSAGIEQVNKAIVQMDEMTQQNAALVEEAASSSEAMGEQARNLNELVSFFKVGDEAQSEGEAPAPDASEQEPSAERRSSERPWKAPEPEADASQPKPLAATGTDGDWEEF